VIETNPCTGNLLPHNYTGAILENRAPAGASLEAGYSYDAWVTTNLTDGVIKSSVCTTESARAVTNSSGEFAFSLDAAVNSSCNFPGGGKAGTCVETVGPYEFVNVSLVTAPPTGYLESVSQSGTSFTVQEYSPLASVQLTPGGPSSTFSPGAMDPFGAIPRTGVGTLAPGAPQYLWSLHGVGWTFNGSSSGPEVNVTAASGAAVGNLSVTATLSWGGAVFQPAPTRVELIAEATAIGSASLNRTAVDLGQPIGVTVEAVGAPGYTYTATIDPGLGEAASPASCTPSPSDGSVALACFGSIDFGATGVAQPTVTVSNGISPAAWTFPEVTVAPAPAVVFLPGTPTGYVNESFPLTVQAATGTGTAPYREACLESGAGPVTCTDSPGPAWTFAPVYRTPGEYLATAWTIDATGANRSASTSIRIVGTLAVAITNTNQSASVGEALSLRAMVSGGELPARVWWNATGVSSPVYTGPVTSDGTVGASYAPADVGFVTLSIVVVDGHGAVASATHTFPVGPGLAAAVVPLVLPSTEATPAGAPISVAWQATDAAGVPVRQFSAPAEIELAIPGTPGAAPGWVNASGLGPLATSVPGWFDVPATAWIAGALNVTVTSRVATTLEVELTVAGGLSTAGGSVAVVVHPDLDHLVLFDPVTRVSGTATNDTLWQVTDRFGNPAVGGEVVVTTSFGGNSVRTTDPVLAEPDGATEVWVNYSAPGGEGGTVAVTDLAGETVLPPVVVPGPAGPWTVSLATLAYVSVILAAAAVAFAMLLGAQRRKPATPRAVPEDDETALRRVAEGQATVVEIVRRLKYIDLAGIAAEWEPPPAPEALADWIASLLTDGTLDATFADDGTARFRLGNPPPGDVRVTLDVEEYDREMRRRDRARAEWDGDDR
jgi:hypothetical protein